MWRYSAPAMTVLADEAASAQGADGNSHSSSRMEPLVSDGIGQRTQSTPAFNIDEVDTALEQLGVPLVSRATYAAWCYDGGDAWSEGC